MRNRGEEIKYNTCPICDGVVKNWKKKKGYNIDVCGSCGFAFVNPRPSLSFLMEYYSVSGHGQARRNYTIEDVLSAEAKYPNAILDAKRIISVARRLSKGVHNSNFLDIGCGYGWFSREAINAGFNVTALELAETERIIAKEMTGLEPIACSFEEFCCHQESFAVVLMSQILEHALDINLWIEKSYDLLVDEGHIVVALPNFGSIFRLLMQEKDPFICPPAHLNYFTPRNLSLFLAKHGFIVEEIQWVSRIPKEAFSKRLPKLAKPTATLFALLSQGICKVIDACHLGMGITVFAKKVKASKA